MEPVLSFDKVREKLEQSNEKNYVVVGLVFADYTTTVKDIIADYYSKWHAETAGIISLYWIGYGKNLNYGDYNDLRDDIEIVNLKERKNLI